GSRVTGAVTSCSSARGAIDIDEGKLEEDTITFKCKSINRVRTVIFKGKINGNEIEFTWDKLALNGGTLNPDANYGRFGPSAPRRFIAKRVADDTQIGELLAGEVRGEEFAASTNSVKEDLKIEGRFFLPSTVSHVRDVIVVIGWGDFIFFHAPQWQK